MATRLKDDDECVFFQCNEGLIKRLQPRIVLSKQLEHREIFKISCFHKTMTAAFIDLGIVYAQGGYDQKAIKCFMKGQLCRSRPGRGDIEKIYIFQNVGVVHLLCNRLHDAVNAFKDALNVLDGVSGQPIMRAHLHLNLGFAYSQMGRKNIWKSFEAYLNAANYAKEINDSGTTHVADENIRMDALRGLTLAAVAIVDYTDEVENFVYEHVTKTGDSVKKKDRASDFREIPEFKNSVTNDDDYAECIENIRYAVLNPEIEDEKSTKS